MLYCLSRVRIRVYCLLRVSIANMMEGSSVNPCPSPAKVTRSSKPSCEKTLMFLGQVLPNFHVPDWRDMGNESDHVRVTGQGAQELMLLEAQLPAQESAVHEKNDLARVSKPSSPK
jgi:hypothetical protein